MDDFTEKSSDDIERDTWADAFFADVMKDEEAKHSAPGLYGQFDPNDPDDPDGDQDSEPSEKFYDWAEEAARKAAKREKNTSIAIAIAALAVLILLVAACVIFLGVIIKKAFETTDSGSASGSVTATFPGAGSGQVEKLEAVFKFISDNYYLEVDPDDLIEGAVAGMAASINDPYGSYIGPAKFDSFSDYLEGRYSGIGIVTERIGAGLSVKEVTPDSPAEKAGIKPGDVVTAVDGRAASEFTEDELKNYFAKEDTAFSLEIESGGATRTVMCKAEKITAEIVAGENLGSGIIYIRIERFTSGSAGKFGKLLEELNTPGTRALVLDLRGNIGGYVNEAVKVADILLPEGTVAVTKDRNGNIVSEYVSGADSAGLKLAVLIDGGTASASELVAAAISDFKAGTTVGTVTYGKGIAQIYRSFEHDGSGINLSSYVAYTPSGKCIDGVGIVPDVTAELLENYKNTKISEIPHDEDAQLEKALMILGD
ncbi:MAG: S41 family peptidase [Clostridia bacterium]|nr:S41 family peptidase [Clostridia bacterium]